MKQTIALLLLLALAACGGGVSSPADVEDVLSAYAQHIMDKDIAGAQKLIINASYDWRDDMERIIRQKPTQYAITEITPAGDGYTATIRWDREEGAGTNCTYVRVAPDGAISLTKSTTKVCPGVSTPPIPQP